jgi:hypothetical protein
MAVKAKKTGKETPKASNGKSAKAAPAPKGGKAAAAAPAAEGAAPEQDAEELEEQAAESATASSGGNAAALAAATGAGEMSASFKNFRHHPDMENFYRFIYENDLRHEALAIIDDMFLQKAERRVVKVAKAHAH